MHQHRSQCICLVNGFCLGYSNDEQDGRGINSALRGGRFYCPDKFHRNIFKTNNKFPQVLLRKLRENGVTDELCPPY